MQKLITQIESKIGEKLYHFVCDPDSPIEHVKEALFQFNKYVATVEDAIKANQATKEEVVAKQEEPTSAQEESIQEEACAEPLEVSEAA